MAALYELSHLAVEEGQEEGSDVRPVDIRVGHDDDFVIPRLEGIELLFPDPGSETLDQGTNLFGREHPVKTRLFDIEDLSAKRENRLKKPIPSLFGRAPRGVSLDDEDLRLFGITLRTIRELAR